MPFRKVPPLAAGVGAGVLIMAVAAVSAAWLYSRSLAAHKRDFQDDLIHTATAAASVVDVDVHRTFVDPAQESSATYLSAIAELDKIKNADKGIKFIYTCVTRGDSIYFVLDPTPAGDADGDGVDDKSHIMQPYPDAGAACRRALATGKPQADDQPYTDAWGTFLSAYAPIFDARQRLVGVVGVDKELTQYLLQAKGMREAGWYGLGFAFVLSVLIGVGVFFGAGALAFASAQRQKALEAAEAASRVKSDFLAVMSHEIRTPLAGVMGLLDALGRTGLAGRQAELARKARACADGMLTLLNDVLDFSKIEAGAVALESAPFDAAALCGDCVDLFRAKAEEKGLTLSLETADAQAAGRSPDAHYRVVGDPARLRQVISNLIGNAVKFTREGGVCVSLGWRDFAAEALEIRVRDTGIGIPAEKIPLLFRKFSQADLSTTREFGGTGLGLAICRSLADLMGGSIDVTSEAGKGSVFSLSLRLPRAGGPAAPGGDWSPAQALDPEFLRGRVFLVADDNPVNREIARMALEDLGGACDFAVNGEEAVAKSSARRYDAVFMDCRMPRLDGYAATAQIRARGGDPVPVIAMTANALSGDREKCLAAGMDDYLTKPLRLEAVAAVLGKHLGLATEPPVDVDAEPAADPIRAPDPDGPAVDAEVLRRLAAGGANLPFVRELAEVYLESLAERAPAMDDAVSARATDRLIAAAHEIAGISSQVGAFGLAWLCKRMEEAARAGDWSAAEDLRARAAAEAARVKTELRRRAAEAAA